MIYEPVFWCDVPWLVQSITNFNWLHFAHITGGTWGFHQLLKTRRLPSTAEMKQRNSLVLNQFSVYWDDVFSFRFLDVCLCERVLLCVCMCFLFKLTSFLCWMTSPCSRPPLCCWGIQPFSDTHTLILAGRSMKRAGTILQLHDRSQNRFL